eukprot:1000688-Amphidinium_carterae.1
MPRNNQNVSYEPVGDKLRNVSEQRVSVAEVERSDPDFTASRLSQPPRNHPPGIPNPTPKM